MNGTMATPRRLLRCSNCGRHVFVDERVCPFCRVARALRTVGISAALAASACGGNASHNRPADSGAIDAVADARTDAPLDAGAAPDGSMTDAMGLDDGAIDAGAPDVYDPCGGPGCPCCIYRAPPPRAIG